jgi:hypothetical protein
MKVLMALLLVVAISTSSASSREPPAKKVGIPDFTIRTTAPERTIYAIVKYFHEHAFLIIEQRVIGSEKFKIRIVSGLAEAVLFLHAMEGGLRSEGSYDSGDGGFYSGILEPLIISLQEPEQP